MTATYQRYAIYFAPELGSKLAAFGRDWLGMDAENSYNTTAPSPYVDSPRRYGFHATLKAPMRLADGIAYNEFRNAVLELSCDLKPVSLGKLQLKSIGSFLALTVEPSLHQPVSALAWKCVTQVDHLRAELNEAERNKRSNLSANQKANLEKWGYPYVGEAFRFHMTLTSSLSSLEMEEAKALLKNKIPSEETTLNSICIFGDSGSPKPFELVERFDLTS